MNMHIPLKSLFLGLILSITTLPSFGSESPKPEPSAQDPFLYAAIHTLSNSVYSVSAAIARETLMEAVLSASYRRLGGPSRIKDIALYTLDCALWLGSLYGRYKLPEVVDSVAFGKSRQRSSIYKLLSLGNRTHYGAHGAFVESFIEQVVDNEKAQKTLEKKSL